MKILITGNGFDLANGLPTNYSNFINTVVKIKSAQDNQIQDDFFCYFEENNIFNRENLTQEYNFVYDKSKLIEFKNILDNIWLNYFIKQQNIYSWVDFESEIEKVIKNLDKILEKINVNAIDKKDFIKSDILSVNDFSLKSQIIDIIIDFKLMKRDVYSNFGVLFNLDFCHVNDRYVIGINESCYFDFLFKQLKEFSNIFDLYLNIFVEPLLQYIKCDKNLFDGVSKHFTFNYTNTFNFYNSNTKTFYLHGKISDKTSKNNIVFGFNDVFESINSISSYIPFTKYYQKISNETDFAFLDSFKIDRINEIQFYFWGHSMFKSDKIYIDEIFEKLNLNKRNVIKIFYHSRKSKDDMLLNLMEMYNPEKIVDMCKKKKIIFIESTVLNLKNELSVSNNSNLFAEVFIV